MSNTRITGNGEEKQGISTVSGLGAGAITPHDAELLRGFFGRIDRLHDERAELNAEIATIYKEAKANGYNTAAMRVTMQRARLDRAELEAQDDLVSIYERVWRGGVIKAPDVAAEHKPAFDRGRLDAAGGHIENAELYPPGTYGHADYWRGHAEGEEEAARLARAPAREEDQLRRVPRRRRAAEAFAS